MEDSNSKPHIQKNNAEPHVTSTPNHVTDSGGSSNGAAGARYKLMSPAKLPISRSTCITVPSGLSPTSFLESPVFLSNVKAEPSPTTGSFLKPLIMPASSDTAVVSLEKNDSISNNVDERASGSFEFNFHTGSSSASVLSSVRLTAGFNRNGLFSQDQRFSQYPAPSALVTQQSSSQEQKLSPTIGIHEVPVHTDEQNQAGFSNPHIQVSSSDQKDSISPAVADRSLEDGYNWRKYGQKLVKGSEFPRSYYKCTYPNCEVKKIFERAPSGQITEIVYKGSHDHAKPQAARRPNAGALVSIQEDFSFTGQEDKLNTYSMDPNFSPALSPLQANEEGVDGSGSQIQGINDDNDEDDPFSKRRKMEDGFDVIPVMKPIREPRVVVQTVSEVDILDDGYRWRKYGQKVVRGNPNPRSYYKCTNAGCPVRKHVERAAHDPKAVITTYEGKHNHDVPAAKNGSSNDYTYSRSSNMRMEDRSSQVSLDLGVGMTHGQNNNEQNNSRMMAVQPSQIPVGYSIVNGGLSMYGSRENRVDGHNNQFPENIGRILMGP